MTPGRTEMLASADPPQSPGNGGGSIHTGFCRACLTIHSVAEIGDKCGCKSEVMDRDWKVSALEDRLTMSFEQEVRRRARKAYQDIERSDPEEAGKMRAQYMNDFAADAYNWDDQGANSQNHVRTARLKTWGMLHMLYLLLNRCDSSVTQEMSEKIWLANHLDAMAEWMWALGLVGNERSPRRSEDWRRALRDLKSRQQQIVAPSANGSTNSSSENGTTKLPETAATFG